MMKIDISRPSQSDTDEQAMGIINIWWNHGTLEVTADGLRSWEHCLSRDMDGLDVWRIGIRKRQAFPAESRNGVSVTLGVWSQRWMTIPLAVFVSEDLLITAPVDGPSLLRMPLVIGHRDCDGFGHYVEYTLA